MDTNKKLRDLTVEDVETAARENAQQYDRMFRKAAKAAKAAFIEGILYAQKLNEEGQL